MAELIHILTGALHLGSGEIGVATLAALGLAKLLNGANQDVRAAAVDAVAGLAACGHVDAARAVASQLPNAQTQKALEQRIDNAEATAAAAAAELDEVGEEPLDFEL